MVLWMQKMVSISDRTKILVVFTVSSIRPLCGVVVIDFLVNPSMKRSNKLSRTGLFHVSVKSAIVAWFIADDVLKYRLLHKVSQPIALFQTMLI
jgi:hypothetical protein